ncbi:MAG: CPXCG motif-containing cysteine-rich protein [Steroidobacteraceae bacterium]
MKRLPTDKQPPEPDPSVHDARSIDALYGLEPVFEPGRTVDGGTQSHLVQCPYCGESFETLLDLSPGSASYIEDCEICCQPIQFSLEVDHAGSLVGLEVLRCD